jgi:hypothetical protein
MVARGAPRIALVAVLALALPATGCSRVLDSASVENEIEKQLERQLSGVNVSIECPEDIPAGRGESFECTATTNDDQKATIAVVQTDDEGTIDFEVQELQEN